MLFREDSLGEKFFRTLCLTMRRGADGSFFTVEDEYPVRESVDSVAYLSRMVKMGLIAPFVRGSGHFVFTDKGKAWAMLYCLRERKFRESEHHCLVSIVGADRRARRAIQNILKFLSFQQLGIGRWIFTGDVGRHLLAILQCEKLERAVNVYSVKEILVEGIAENEYNTFWS